MIRFDVSYAKTVSIWSDLKILLKTVPAVIEQAMDK
jgi:lipopolysaccharide/colanic/teichoic acid biosynthesis glycosyltransferase